MVFEKDVKLSGSVSDFSEETVPSKVGRRRNFVLRLLRCSYLACLIFVVFTSLHDWNSFLTSHDRIVTFLKLNRANHGPALAVRWGHCDSAHPLFECGSIDVPKDYLNSTSGIATIAVNRLPATAPSHLRLGSLFLNPGGPGGSGVQFGFSFAPTLHSLTDGRYDIIGFDPRGIGQTKPLVSCFGSERALEDFKAHTVLENGLDIAPGDRIFEGAGREHLYRQIEEMQMLRKTQYELCGQVMGDDLRYMSTNTVVRDIDAMSLALDKGKYPINFFGGSYGTILGAYLAQYNSSRLGRILIDGVASSPSWANKPPYLWLYDWLAYTDKTFDWFLRDCSAAGPERGCPLAKEVGEDPAAIAGRLDAFLDGLYDHPIAVPDGVRPGILTSGAARSHLYLSTNLPTLWPLFAELFAEALDGNVTRLYNSRIGPFASRARDETDLSRVAVSCGDSPAYGDGEGLWKKPTREMLGDEFIRTLKGRSRRFGASVSFEEPDGACEFHPANGKVPERYTGPWNNTLSTPMLIVSNTADPITPLSSGQELDSLMGPSSSLLIQDSPGHCSLGSVSRCTTGWYRRYLLTGDVPPKGTVCGVDQGYFFNDDGHADNAQGEEEDTGEVGMSSTALREHAEELQQRWVGWMMGRHSPGWIA